LRRSCTSTTWLYGERGSMATTTLNRTERRLQDRRAAMKQAKRNAWAYAFISPFYILYAVFGMFPLLYGLWLSLHKWDGISPMQWVGAANYIKLLTDDIWWKAIYNTIWLFVGATVPQLMIALLLAFIINTPYIKGKDFFRAAFFAPNVASAVAVSLIFTSLLGTRYGMFNYALSLIGLGPVDWLGSSTWIKPSIAMVTIWQWT